VAGVRLCVLGDVVNPYTRHKVFPHLMVATFFLLRGYSNMSFTGVQIFFARFVKYMKHPN